MNDYGIGLQRLIDSKPCKYEATGDCLGTRHCEHPYDCEVKKFLKRQKHGIQG